MRANYLTATVFIVLVTWLSSPTPATAQPSKDNPADSQQETSDEIILSGDLGDEWLGRLQAMPGLDKLTIVHPENLTEKSLARLADLQGLETFRGEEFPIDSPLADAAVKALAAIPTLRTLALKATGITDTGIEALAGSPLTELTLQAEERLTGDALEHVAAIPGLRRLTIHSTPVDARGLKHLQGCPQLKELALPRIICRKDRVEAVAGIKTLERLTLSRAGYHDLVVLQSLVALRHLRLQYSGAIKAAESIGKLTQLETVQFVDCDFRNETLEEVKAKLAEVGIAVVEPEHHEIFLPEPGTPEQMNEATKLAHRAHAALAGASDFPAFWLKWRTQAGKIPAMSAEPIRTIRRLKLALQAEADMTTFGREEITFAWAPGQFFDRSRSYMPKTPDNVWQSVKFGTKDWAWAREQRNDDPPLHVLRAGVAEFAESFWPIHQAMRVTPKPFWWGDNSHHNMSTSSVPLHFASYCELPGEEFAGEPCRVVESSARGERLWISKKTGLLRGHLDYMHQGYSLPFHRTDLVTEIVGHPIATREDYWRLFRDGDDVLPKEKQDQLRAAWSEYCFGKTSYPGSLRVFDDYREIAEGRWFPFHVVSAGWLHHKDDNELYRFHVNESRVDEVRTDLDDLSTVWEPFLPNEGSRVQDQRFAATVEYEFRHARPEAEILELVNAKLLKQAETKQHLAQLTEPVQQMVGKSAPSLPDKDWIGERPDLKGKPYLLHFWAVWCGPCKNDVSMLNLFAKNRIIIGVHPSGTPVDEVRKAVVAESMGYPTIVDNGNSDGILGYPVKMFPYCIEVDERGKVTRHGSLRDIFK